MTSATDLIDAARMLAPEQRLWLIDQIWNSLSPDEWPVLSETEMAEVQRRSAAYDAGQETASSWEDVRARLTLGKKADD